ncbi:MAG: phosphoribosylformylglycinamidine synthase [Planctomycetes bacterium DG_58]|nr:MAG: phosphoribosylformylglycinamidine synthase [Planctomycetes bacterium DG_58]
MKEKVWRIEVATREDLLDPAGEAVKSDIADLGVAGVAAVRFVRVFFVRTRETRPKVQRIATELLSDPICDVCAVGRHVLEAGPGVSVVEVVRKPGVMDPVEASSLKGIADMGYRSSGVHTARRYLLTGELSGEQLVLIAEKLLANPSIEQYYIGRDSPSRRAEAKPYRFKLITVSVREMSDDELAELAITAQLYLSLEEMQAIRRYYRRLRRDPTDVELETLAQTWSEHCVHKTFKGLIEYDGPPISSLSRGETIDNLLKSTVMRVTRELDKPWCISVFEDNAGVIEFDDEHHVCFKVETHNHPSAIEPYGGAGTGIGGVIRDPMGTGLGAKPIANTDVFCFGRPEMKMEDVPKGALHPKRVMKGVVAGVRDYGNRMGIPTVNGAVLFDDRFVGNPLVYCGTVGLIPVGKEHKRARKGDLIIVVGGRTGRDGIHGVTFASAELTGESETVSSGAVQIGNPIVEKKMVDVLLVARDRGLYTCVTDCGGGGLSSAVGEMGEKLGVEVHLERVPLKYKGLNYCEIWISEAQERMLLAVPPENEREILKLFRSENVEATTIGRFTGAKRLELFYRTKKVADLDMKFLHHGFPRKHVKAVWRRPPHEEPLFRPVKDDYGEELKAILSSYDVASKEWVVRQYDHEVQGGSAVKPLVGVDNDGPGDAAVVAPNPDSNRGIVISCGINPCYSDIDPYWMAASAIDEALRQIIAVGGSLKEVALLDNFCWGRVDKPEVVGALVRAAKACYDQARVFGTPFISGKDSLNNEFRTESGTIAVPYTLLISAIGVIDDVTRCITMDLKSPGNPVYVLGLTRNELGASQYYRLLSAVGNRVPKVDARVSKRTMNALARATARRLVRAAHDLSEGGLAVAAAEMAFAGGLGLALDLKKVPTDDELDQADSVLFSESNSRFLVEVEKGSEADFEKLMKNVTFARIGEVTDTGRLVIKGPKRGTVIDEDVRELKAVWKAPLAW